MNAVQHSEFARWLVLRCGPARTLPLAKSLSEAGMEAWAPVHEGAPMTAGYVFAPVRYLTQLLELTHNPVQTYRIWDPEKGKMVTRGHPYFRIMPSLDPLKDWAIVSDRQLNPLRGLAEGKRKPRGTVKTVEVGASVRVNERGFEGMTGQVKSVSRKFAKVMFPGFPVPVDIGCWLLTEILDEPKGVKVSNDPNEPATKAA